MMFRVLAISMCLWAASGGAASPVRASAIWVDGAPVFLSDIRRREQQRQVSPPVSPQVSLPAARPVAPHPVYPANAGGGPRPEIAPEAPAIVELPQPETPGTIIIDQQDRKLFYVLTSTQAFLYPISVGRDGFRWSGEKRITAIRDWPEWNPPAEMRERQPWLPVTMSGGINNPLGVKALYLGTTLYRIHGTNDPNSIGYAASSGCFRMMNGHVLHLASLVDVGTTVRVLESYPG